LLEKHFRLLLVAVVVVGLGLGALIAAVSPTQTASGQVTSAGQRTSAQGQSGAFRGAGVSGAAGATAQASASGSRPVAGSVASVDGNTLTIATQQGETKVNLTGAKIEKSVAGSTDDLKANQRVMVVGEQGQDGVFTASSVQLLAADASRGMMGQFRGQGQTQGQGQGQGQSQRQGQGQGQSGAGGRALAGSVVSLDGDTLTISGQQGEGNIKVKLAGAPIQKTVDAAVSDLKAGLRVVVTGHQGADGVLAATNVQITAEAQSAQGQNQPASQPTEAPPEFKAGFKALADQIPDIVGQPVENEHYAANGDALQKTTTGLMVWRKSDNLATFTNGTRTWILGPNGIQDRPNDAHFPWEKDQPSATATLTSRSSQDGAPARQQ